MKGRRLWAGLFVLVLCLLVVFLTGCSKKGEMKNRLLVIDAEKPAAGAAAGTAEEQAARERALQRQRALQEQTLREQTAGKAAGRETPEAADRAKKEGSAQEAAILKELQIPDILFEYDKYSLTPEAQEILRSHAPVFVKYKEYRLVVEGHCDERGTVEYNLALGEERAAQAAKYLVNLGIEKERIKTISYGKEKPLEPGHDETAWVKNRRAHFVVFPPVNK
ncbi:MAG: peptidoglycan-associated lipoprotein Pal [Deltaproteobacteria bacterium]|nr:peptidoglycan-associated lipoprotein Pal [Deltaproteobacteria bacterium]